MNFRHVISTDQTADLTAAQSSRLVAVVVTHRRLAQLQVTLRSLLSTPRDQLAAVLVVDNASDKATGTWLAAQTDPRLVVVRSDVNTGGAGGFAMGMKAAMERLAPDWIVLMDDDARPKPGALRAFHALDLDAYDGFAAAVALPDGTVCDINRPTFNPFWRKHVMAHTLLGGGRDAFHLGPDDFDTPGLRTVDGASFAAFFVRASAVRKQGYPDPSLFLYGDDTLYTLGLTRAGHPIGFDPSVMFEHDNQTYSATDPRIRPLWKVYYYYRNLLIVYRMSAGVFFAPVFILYLLRWLSRVRHYKGQRGTYLRLFAMAMRDGLLRRTGISHDTVLNAALNRPGVRGDTDATAAAPKPSAPTR